MTRKQISIRQAAAVASLALVVVLAGSTSARTTLAESAPVAHAARRLNVTDTAKLHLISTSGSVLNEAGTAQGALPGAVKTRFQNGSTNISATVTFYPRGGTITIKGSGALHSSGVIASFGGSMRVLSATGVYAHARGTGGFYGTVNRRTWQLTVQTTGKLSY